MYTGVFRKKDLKKPLGQKAYIPFYAKNYTFGECDKTKGLGRGGSKLRW